MIINLTKENENVIVLSNNNKPAPPLPLERNCRLYGFPFNPSSALSSASLSNRRPTLTARPSRVVVLLNKRQGNLVNLARRIYSVVIAVIS